MLHKTLKISTSLLFLGISAFPFTTHSEDPNINIYQKLSSINEEERLEALKNIKNKKDQTLYTTLIDMALFDIYPEIRAEAERRLSFIQPMNPRASKLRAHLSSIFPQDQIAALKSIKKIENTHPIIQYTVLKEFIFRSVSFHRDSAIRTTRSHREIIKERNLELQKALTRITAAYPYFQNKLLQAIASDKISETAQSTAKEILIRIFKSLDKNLQEKLVHIATSDTFSKAVQNRATAILTFGFRYLYTEIQGLLIHRAVFNRNSESINNPGRDVLVDRFAFIKPERQQELIDIATSSTHPQQAQSISKYIIIRGSKKANMFVGIEMQQTLLDRATSPTAPQMKQKAAKDILTQRFEAVAEEVLRELVHRATSDTVPEMKQRLARSILLESPLKHPSLIIEKELLYRVTDHTASETERNTAQMILVKRINSNSITSFNEELQKEMAYIINTPVSSRTTRNAILDIFIHINQIQPAASSFKLKCQIAFRKLVTTVK